MAKILINMNECLFLRKTCSRCVDECPMQLLKLEPLAPRGEVVVEEKMCIECRNCEVTCPRKCIQIKPAEWIHQDLSQLQAR